ncbi:MAG: hypothetical protein J6A49_06810 [Clostridia bacterium]|nr:hypothetical protein [Clostridia bacterium]
MADYTYSEIMKMQNDAIKRVEDMQKKARKTAGLEKEKEENGKPLYNIPSQEPRRVPMPNDYLEKLKNYASNSSYTDEEEHKEEKTDKEEKPKNHHKGKENVFSDKTENTFSDLNIDEDKALLLALIMLLSEEKGDELLIMALIYMLT